MSLTLGEFLKRSTSRLDEAGVPTARLDILVLMEDCLGMDRSQIIAHPEFQLKTAPESLLSKQISRRAKHEPLAFIRGRTEFYRREFLINRHVLEPRPETETMIDILKELKNDHSMKLVDLGTGSGAIAITAKLELPYATVIATDISRRCLKISRLNAQKHEVNINFMQGNLLKPLLKAKIGFSVLLANLPYIPDNFRLNMAAANEPRTAIFGGPDGLDLYRKMFKQVEKAAKKPSFILTESLPPQQPTLENIANSAGYKLYLTQDFIQVFAG
jgi:release factor glutamine methyltransferase